MKMFDFITAEAKLLSLKNRLEKNKRYTELLSKIDIITEKIISKMPEKIPVTFKIEEVLSLEGKLELPLRVRGTMLGVGRHKRRYYTAKELMKSVDTNKDRLIPFKIDHRKTEAGATIGKIDNIFWDENLQVLRYEAHINDETHARNIIDGVINEVSAGIAAVDIIDSVLGIVGVELEYTELSIVDDGAFEGSTIEAII